MAVAAADQTALDEEVVENADLEGALEARQVAKEDAAIANKRAKEAHERATAEIDKLEIDEGAVVRVGRFRVEKAAVAARSVSFETAPTTRLKISKVED